MKLLPKISPRSAAQRQADYERSLIRMEAKIGGQLFGPIPKDHHREFFCLDEHTWVWHEEWTENGQRKVVATRYIVRPDGVLKSLDGKTYHRLTIDEARNLYRAVEMYEKRVDAEYQRMFQSA